MQTERKEYGIMAMNLREFKIERDVLRELNLWGVFTVKDLMIGNYQQFIKSNDILPDGFNDKVTDFRNHINAII